MKEVEIEAKAFIEEDGYKTIFLNHPELKKHIYTQANYYIDTPDEDLRKSPLSMRVRTKSNNFQELTIKEDLKEGKLEINQPMSSEELVLFLEKGIIPEGEVLSYIRNKYPSINIKDLKVFTKLVTDRCDIKVSNGLLSIDKNKFSGITDFEVECESDSMEHAKEILFTFLEKEKVPYIENHKSKLYRARQAFISQSGRNNPHSNS